MAIGRRNGMVQMLHIPLYCDHDTCSISISTHRRIRITSPYVKVAQLRRSGRDKSGYRQLGTKRGDCGHACMSYEFARGSNA